MKLFDVFLYRLPFQIFRENFAMKLCLIFFACISVSCPPRQSPYPTREELTGIYFNLDTSRHESLGIFSTIPFERSNWGMIYRHWFRDKDGKEISSSGWWKYDIGKGRDYSFGYPNGSYRMEFYNWNPYPGDSILPYGFPDKYLPRVKPSSVMFGFAHYDLGKKNIVIDSFYREPNLKFTKRGHMQ
jgi:hypothetical protein